MEENYLLAKIIVSNKYEENNPYYPLFVVAIYALLNKYPNEHLVINEIFSKTDIYIEKDTIQNILDKYGYYKEGYFEEKDNNDINITYGLSSYDYTFSITNDNQLRVKEHIPFLICNSKDISPTILLNVFIHEMNHLIKGYYNTYKKIEGNNEIGYYIRSGINYYWYRYFINTDTLYEYDFFQTLDEAINTLQTTEMMTFIKDTKHIVPDKKITRYIESLNQEELEKDFGYEFCTSLIKPLWKNNRFKKIIEDNILDGNVDTIIESFDSNTQIGSFEKLADLLDELDELDAYDEVGIKLLLKKLQIKKIINSFNKQKTLIKSFSK